MDDPLGLGGYGDEIGIRRRGSTNPQAVAKMLNNICHNCTSLESFEGHTFCCKDCWQILQQFRTWTKETSAKGASVNPVRIPGCLGLKLWLSIE